MGQTNTCNLREDERLAKEVRKYTCLYDKADKGYNERVRTENAWQAIDIALRYEECKNNNFKLNDFKHKTHSKSSRQRYMQVFSCL